MKLIRILLLISCCISTLAPAKNKLDFPILFWNVENLFDCKHDSLKNDYDFLPEALKHWTPFRYKQKLRNIAKTIITTSKWTPPAIIGLCEVENDAVISDLTQQSILKNLEYRYICTQSKDERGIDVALLYLPERFKVIQHQAINIGKLPNGRVTRDILYVEGFTASADTLDLFIVHLPSRYGGKRKSEPNRIFVANKLKQQIEQIKKKKGQSAKLIIMGDFNDYPHNASILKVLQAKEPSIPILESKLYHLLARKRRQHDWGTYKYKSEWGVLDHFIINGNLLINDSFYTSEENTEIIRASFLLEEDPKYGGYKPFRTYNGMHYLGGYSDHLPILSTFTEVVSN